MQCKAFQADGLQCPCRAKHRVYFLGEETFVCGRHVLKYTHTQLGETDFIEALQEPYKRQGPPLRAVIAFRPDQALGLWFPSMSAAAEAMGTGTGALHTAIVSPRIRGGRRKRVCKGWCWAYAQEE